MRLIRNALALGVATALCAPQAVLADSVTGNILTVAQANAQPASQAVGQGSIQGRVRDANRDVFLNGALVTVEGSNREARTDRTGSFSLSGLQPGTYQLTVDYLGYSTRTVEVTVAAGERAQLDVQLQDEAVAMGVMNVQAIRDIQSRSLNRQRAADNIVNVVSADSIGNFPDGNVAESLARNPGIGVERHRGEGKYINVRGTPADFSRVALDGVSLPTPDGGSRAVDLDTIPTDIVSSLEVTKALTPDLPADSIGGHVNIVTQSAFDSDGPIIRGSAGYGINDLGNLPNHNLGLTLGNTFADDRIGVVVSGTHSRVKRDMDNVEHDWDQDDEGRWFATETDFKDYESDRERYALTGRLDFRLTDRTSLYLTGTHSKFIDDEMRHNVTMEYDGVTPDSTPREGTFQSAEVEKQLRHRLIHNTINSISLGGEHQADRFDIDFTVSAAQAKQRYPTRDYIIYELNHNPDVHYDWSDPNNPTLRVDGIDNLNFADEDFEFSEYQRRARSGDDREYSVASNLAIPFQLANADSEAKFGFRLVQKEKSQDESRHRNRAQLDGAPNTFDQVARNERSTNFDYELGNRFDTDAIANYGHIWRNDENYSELLDRRYTGDYTAQEDVYAVYGMNTLDWGRTRLVGGVRVEHTRTDAEAYRWDDDNEEAVLQQAANSYTNVFPSVHLRQELNRNFVLRAAYSTSIYRPNLTHISPYADVEEARQRIDVGNPDLNPTFAHNFDLMAEYYIRPLGILSAGAFYKRLDDPIFRVRQVREWEGVEGWRVDQRENGDSGRIYGFEMNWEQGLTFLPGPLAGFGVFANYTYTDSEADLPRDQGTVQLPGQSKHTANLALYYEWAGFSTRVSYNYRSEFLDSVDHSSRENDTWWDARDQVDVTASYQVTNALQVYAHAMNVTDSAQNRYKGSDDRVYERERFGRAYQAGVRFNF